MINNIIDSACVPAEWKLAKFCPVFKKNDRFDKSKYRTGPVSILVVLDKVFESFGKIAYLFFAHLLFEYLSTY